MNNNLIMSQIRSDREYSELLNSLKASGKGLSKKPHLVSGISESADSYFHAALAEDIISHGKNILFLFPDDKDAAAEAEFLMSYGIPAMKYSARDFNFNNMAASHEFEYERLSVISSLAGYSQNDAFAVCSGISAALQVTLPCEIVKEKTIVLDISSVIDLDELSVSLLDFGYKKVEIVEGAGQFARRGGIIDIFVPTGNAYRIELFGDEVDRIGTFDPESQRFSEMCEHEIIIPPARELLITDEIREQIENAIQPVLGKIQKSGNVIDNERSKKLLEAELSDIRNKTELNFADKYLPIIYPNGKSLIEMFDGVIVLINPNDLEARANASYTLLEQSLTDMIEHFELNPRLTKSNGYSKEWNDVIYKFTDTSTVLTDTISRSYEGLSAGTEFDLASRHVSPYGGRREVLEEDIRSYVSRGWKVAVCCASESERSALTEKLVESGMSAAAAIEEVSNIPAGAVVTLCAPLKGGFELSRVRFALLDYSSDIGGKRAPKILKRKKKKSSEAIMSYADLEVGDLVVHASYGVGQYLGLSNLTVAGVSRDYVTIKYAGTDQLFLPVDQLDLVSKYIGAGSDGTGVKLSKMGGADWNRAKSKAKAATREMAHELIELYAARKRAKGIAFAPDDDMCREFAASFEYEETDGQLIAIDDVRRDMEAAYPMDRLVCGDVGYGKTEVAMRAAFKAAMSGHQVAILVPTTILAYQHFKNFKSRMRQFPVNVDMVSRFRSPSEQKSALRRLKRGETDIIIGTHRIISSDVEFYDLGLVIIDEEQRFGVAQKEKLKKIATGADVLTLTATPIPRTLNMAMGGIVDMSLLEEAPGARAPVQTYVLEYDDMIIYEAIRRELRRSGQVFYMYNRVEGIYNVAGRISKAIPDARIAVAHGKMEREELEEIWEALIRGEIDILVCTTIIETGVDIPNANTLIIENADMYGLSQLHQIRGRVGRSGRRAYAYFTYRKNKNLTEIAEKRLTAIKEYAEFGAGFKIALRDLEIRGAGNLLGAEQHGHMEAVGYDLYMKLLNEAVIEEKGEKIEKKPECTVDIQADAYLSKNYIPSSPQRMEMYKKIARITCEDDYDDMIDEICDRFGEPSAPALNLCRIALIRAAAANAGFIKIAERDGKITLTPETIIPAAVTALAEEFSDCRVKVILGAQPSITCNVRKGERNTEFLIDLISAYSSLITK